MNDEDFLARWSRRKRAAEVASEPPSPAPLADLSGKEGTKSAAEPENGAAEEFDLSVLPSIESITASTDVTAFLRKEVPLALTREALRRAWVADPAIRDFVELAENAWDFNNPNAMEGFGALDCTPEEVRDLVARIVGDRSPVGEDDPNPAASQLQRDVANPADALRDNAANQTAMADVVGSGTAQVENDRERAEARPPAPSSSSPADGDSQPRDISVVRRTHGSALPR